MNELNLNAMGVTEMNNRQMKEVDGGIGAVAAFALIGACYGSIYALGYLSGVSTALVKKIIN